MTRKQVFIVLVLIGAQLLVLLAFGQPLISDSGVVKFWEGNIHSSGMSQHLTDWYTFSHIIHGILFFYLLKYLFPAKPLMWRLAIAVGIEAAWEIAENSTMVIEHYRQQALAAGYTGDSILNSISDTAAMMLGFFFASRTRATIVIAAAVAAELFTLYMIRDNLTLNVINLIHVVPAIDAWQAGVR